MYTKKLFPTDLVSLILSASSYRQEQILGREKVFLFLLSFFLFAGLGSAADLVIDGGSNTLSGENTYDKVEVINGGTLYTSGGSKVKINANSIFVDSNSRIYADGRGKNGGSGGVAGDGGSGQGGYGGSGTGAGSDGADGYDSSSTCSAGGGAGGASYGGGGGSGGDGGDDNSDGYGGSGGSGGSTYGSKTDKTYPLGSGGGGGGGAGDCSGQSGGTGGSGGGAIFLNADTIDIQGEITADGANGAYGGDAGSCCTEAGGGGGGGGGSGGTVLIDGGDVTVAGTVTAQGGSGGSGGSSYGSGDNGQNGQSGGGGRIKIFYCNITDSGSYYVSGYNSGTVYKTEDAGCNSAPIFSSGPSPSDGTTKVSTPPTLSVNVSDSDTDLMDVCFYDNSDSSQFGCENSVSDGGTASTTWSGLSSYSTYKWYAVADDGNATTQSSTWNFTTDYQICDSRDSIGACVMSSSTDLGRDNLNPDSRFVMGSGSVLFSKNGMSTIDISNSTVISGIINGNIHINSEQGATVKGDTTIRAEEGPVIIS